MQLARAILAARPQLALDLPGAHLLRAIRRFTSMVAQVRMIVRQLV